VALMLTLNRHTHRAVARVRDGNFSLDGLLGFDLHGKTVGVVGTGRIGLAAVSILRGFGCRVLAFDPVPAQAAVQLGAEYVTLDRLLAESDVVTLHCPLSPASRHLIDASAIARMKRGVMLINTSRGALVDARAAIEALKTGHLGYLGLDVYEEEADLFFEDLSSRVLQDDVLARLLTFPNVIVTSHQAFFTHEALAAIAETTLSNVRAFVNGEPLVNTVSLDGVVAPAR
jgi:D-lactate dehydrogenase